MMELTVHFETGYEEAKERNKARYDTKLKASIHGIHAITGSEVYHNCSTWQKRDSVNK